jgi:ribonucleoside-triphosphate reductase (thioredoxin)
MFEPCFTLNDFNLQRSSNFGFGGFGELVYYRTYSRCDNGAQETWIDTVKRVINGIMSIRKWYYQQHNIPWYDGYWQDFARDMAVSMFKMEWLPPGRGLWAMGTPLMYERGSMALYNCAYTEINTLTDDLCWMMDALMHGVGVGFKPNRDDNIKLKPRVDTINYIVDDSREGWVNSVHKLLDYYLGYSPKPIFDYTQIRKAGEPLKTFGGTASGPQPLIDLHSNIITMCEEYIHNHHYDSVMLKTDLANLIGCCVVAGNVRRSAEIAISPVSDPIFMDLKDYNKYTYRKDFGWMSNNSVILESSDDFDRLGDIAYRVMQNGEPGYINYINLRVGRIGDNDYTEDQATGINPCGEIPLEDKEVCNVADTCPTRCASIKQWLNACMYATFYTSTVALLPTHQSITNSVVARNRRIGVGIVDFAEWKRQYGTHKVIRCLRRGYHEIRGYNKLYAREAGVPESIRVTTVKPGGTTTKLMGRIPGIMHPTATYMIRRIRVQKGTPFEKVLIDAHIPYEPCNAQPDYTNVFEYPVYNGEVRPIEDVSLWEQASNLVLLQREWADNAVSNTLIFKSTELNEIEHVLSSIAPVTKSVTMLPHMTDSYPQMPEEPISRIDYLKRVESISPIDWTTYRQPGVGEKYCDTESCSMSG